MLLLLLLLASGKKCLPSVTQTPGNKITLLPYLCHLTGMRDVPFVPKIPQILGFCFIDRIISFADC